MTILKHRIIFAALLDELARENYKIGDRLPPERDFASKLNVNMATIRRAFQELVLAGIVIKRIGSGTYLQQKIGALSHDRQINLIVDENASQAFGLQVQRSFTEIIEQSHRNGRIIHTTSETSKKLLLSCIQFKRPMIFISEPTEFIDELKAHPELVVILSSLQYENKLPCVLSDDHEVVTMQMEHLRKQGCKQIALLASDTASSLQALQISIWEKATAASDRDRLLLKLQGDLSNRVDAAYHTVLQSADLPFDGLICLSDEMAFGALAALRAIRRRIPEDVAVTSIGNTVLARYSAPPITSVMSNADGHIQAALDLIDYNCEHPDNLEYVRFVESTLVVRDSTAR